MSSEYDKLWLSFSFCCTNGALTLFIALSSMPLQRRRHISLLALKDEFGLGNSGRQAWLKPHIRVESHPSTGILNAVAMMH